MMKKYILSILVDNEFGALARVVGLFSARGYNVESLSVAVVDYDRNLSRITVVTSATVESISLIVKLLERLVPVHSVINLTQLDKIIEREFCLCKVESIGDKKKEAFGIAQLFDAKISHSDEKLSIFEFCGNSEKVDNFVNLMKPLGLKEVSRTGIVSLSCEP